MIEHCVTCQELKEARDDFCAALRKCEEDLQTSEARVAYLRKEVAQLAENSADWEEELLDTQNILKEVRKENETLRRENSGMRGDINCLQASIDDLEAKQRGWGDSEALYGLLRQYFYHTCPIGQREGILNTILEEIGE